MTVKQFIEQLSKFPENAQVLTTVTWCEFLEIAEIKESKYHSSYVLKDTEDKLELLGVKENDVIVII
jgi:hypothetical protein